VPYLSASAVVIHSEEALYQVYAPLALPLPLAVCDISLCYIRSLRVYKETPGALPRPLVIYLTISE